MVKGWVASGATPLLAIAIPLYKPGQGHPLAPGAPVVNRPPGCISAKNVGLVREKTGIGAPVAVKLKSYRAPASPSGGRPLVNAGACVAALVVLINMDIVVAFRLFAAISGLPSPLKSPVTICSGPGPVAIVNGV